MKTLIQAEKSAPKLWVSALLGWIIAFAGLLIIFVISSLLGVPMEVTIGDPRQAALVSLSIVWLVPATLVPAIAATGLFELLRLTFPRKGIAIFQGIAFVILLVSFASPFSLPVSLVNKLILSLMHIATAAAIIWALTMRK